METLLSKQDFEELSSFQLLQNVWCYNDSIIYLEERGMDLPEYLIIHLDWNEDIIFERWDYSELPRCDFVLRKIKEQKRLQSWRLL